MKRLTIKLGNGRCLMIDWDSKHPIELDVHLGYYGKRWIDEMHKLRDKFN